MRCLVVHAHPDPDSFNAALFRRVERGLRAADHEVDTIDLHRSDFNPCMSEQEHRRVTPYGSGRLEVTLLGDAGRRTIGRTLRLLCGRRCRTTWLAMHRLDNAPDAERRDFLDRVEREIAAL